MPSHQHRLLAHPPGLPARAPAPREQPGHGNAAAAQLLAFPPGLGHQAVGAEAENPILAALEAQAGQAADIAPVVGEAAAEQGDAPAPVAAATPYALAPRFLDSLENPELVERYRGLEAVAPRVLDATANAPQLGNSANQVKRGEVDGRTYFAKKGSDVAELHREAMIPLMGHALGLRSMALAGLAVGGDSEGRVVTESTGGTSAKDLLERGSPEDVQRLSAADPAGIQQALLACMLFQEKDGHADQFHVGPDGAFSKIDHGDMGLNADEVSRPQFTGASPREAPASSFAAAMPGAQDDLTPEVLETIRGWDRDKFIAMQRAAVYGNAERPLFENDTINRQAGNMDLIRHLVNQADGRISGAALFDQFGAMKHAMATNRPVGAAHPEVLARRAQTVEDSGELAFPGSSVYHIAGRAGTASPALEALSTDPEVVHAAEARGGYAAMDHASNERAKDRDRARVHERYRERKSGFAGFFRRPAARRARDRRLAAIDAR
jgi:hypothetical protein